MRTPRVLTGLALTALAVSIAPVAAQAASAPSNTSNHSDAVTAQAGVINWGPVYGKGKRSKASGSLTVKGEDHAVLATADTVKFSGQVYDLTRSSSTCSWVLFRVGYRVGSNLPSKNRYVRDCSYGTPQRFTFLYHDVSEVELKVCSEARDSEPSLNCLYEGTWKVLYLSK